MSEISRYTDVGHKYRIRAINKLLNDKNSFFYSNCWNKSYIIKYNDIIQKFVDLLT